MTRLSARHALLASLFAVACGGPAEESDILASSEAEVATSTPFPAQGRCGSRAAVRRVGDRIEGRCVLSCDNEGLIKITDLVFERLSSPGATVRLADPVRGQAPRDTLVGTRTLRFYDGTYRARCDTRFYLGNFPIEAEVWVKARCLAGSGCELLARDGGCTSGCAL